MNHDEVSWWSECKLSIRHQKYWSPKKEQGKHKKHKRIKLLVIETWDCCFVTLERLIGTNMSKNFLPVWSFLPRRHNVPLQKKATTFQWGSTSRARCKTLFITLPRICLLSWLELTIMVNRGYQWFADAKFQNGLSVWVTSLFFLIIYYQILCTT